MELNCNLQDSNNDIVDEPQDLFEEIQEPPLSLHGICKKCGQSRSHYRWCQSCERNQCKENFSNWTSGNEIIDEFLQSSQLNSTRPQTFLEWIPFERLENIKYLDEEFYKPTRSTIYSAIWIDGPRILWNEENEQYERSKIQVLIKMYNKDQVNKIINELKIYLDCHTQDCDLLIQFYGISKHPENNEYFIVKQYSQNGSLYDYVLKNFNNLNWEIKLHMLLYLSKDLKALHDSGYVHNNFYPTNILVFDNNLCAISTFSKCRKDLPLSNTDDNYKKANDIYEFGMIMYIVGTGYIPYDLTCAQSFDSNTFLTLYRLAPKFSKNIPKSFKELMERCWNPVQELCPDINEIYNNLLHWWSFIYHKCLNSVCIEFLTINNRNYSKPKPPLKPHKTKLKEIVLPNKKNLEPSELIDFIINNHFIKFININELTTMISIGDGHFGTIWKAIWKKTNNLVVCKKLKNNESISKKQIEAFLHELNMHRRLDFCSRIIRILGISFDESTKEYLLVIQYADGGDLRKYLKCNFLRLTWDDKIRFAYQITEGIKFLQGENILHRDLHSKNIVIHQGEAKIIDLGIAKRKMLGIQDDANDDNDNDDNNDIKDSNNEQKNDNNTVYDVHNDCDDLFIPSDDDDQ
ncbi:unnamed protein product [Rhizophagus irregularis]|nr:unnamed protein product [Rhizophagus irregularis]